MGFTLNLRVTGLCAIVPLGGGITVVLPNARDYDDQGSALDPSAESERHIAILGVQTSGSQGSGRKSFPIPASSGLATFDIQAYPLNMEDLSILPVKPAPVSLRPPAGDYCPSNNYPENDFAWATNMADVQAGRIDPIVTAGPFPNKLVLARLTVTAGTWTTDALADSPISADPTKITVRWYYADMNGVMMNNSPRRAIADVLLVQIPIESTDTVTFQSSLPNHDITINGGGRDVNACLANVPLSTLLGSPVGIRTAEMHFSHFYRLAFDKPMRYVPTPDIAGPNCGPSGSATQLGPHCPPTQFAS
jgi:hypothetical protein